MDAAVDSPPKRGLSLGFVTTSAFASAIGVVLAASLADDLGVAVAGAIAGNEPVLYHNQVVYLSGDSDLALGGGVVLSLLVGAFFLLLYPGSNRYDAGRLTTLWVALHCFRQGLMPMALLPFAPDSRFGRAFSTLDVPAGFDLVVTAAGIVGIVSVALASAPAFLSYASHRTLIDTPAKRFWFVVKLAVVGGLVGPLLAVPFFLPDTGTGFIQALPLAGAFTVLTAFAAIGTRSVRIADYLEDQRWSWLPVGWLVFMGVVVYLLLRQGLRIPPSLDDPFAGPPPL